MKPKNVSFEFCGNSIEILISHPINFQSVFYSDLIRFGRVLKEWESEALDLSFTVESIRTNIQGYFNGLGYKIEFLGE